MRASDSYDERTKVSRLLEVDPPFFLLLSLAAIVASIFFFPGARWIPAHWNLLGLLPLAAGVVLNLLADRRFNQMQNSVKPLGATRVLMTRGVFRISRHPMYLGFVLILLGAAMLSGTATPFVVVLVFWAFMDVVFVRSEERKLARIFEDAWLEYEAAVRRWI